MTRWRDRKRISGLSGRAETNNLAIRRLKDPAMKRQIRLVSRSKYPRRAALEALGKLVKASVAGVLATS
ncbi:MAG: hypothetical protein WCF20_13000 [Methylovirgula sp.]